MALALAGIHYSDKGKNLLAATLFGLGTMYKPFSILPVFPILVHRAVKKEWKTIFSYVSIISIICIIISSPFFFIDYEATIRGYLYNSGKMPDSLSIFNVLQIRSKNLPFVIQGTVLILLFLLIVYKFNVFESCSFESITLFLALFIMLNKNLYPHYFLWAFLFLAYWYIGNDKLIHLSFILSVDTFLCILYWINPTLTRIGITLPLAFQTINWSAIGYAIAYAIHKKGNRYL